MMNTPLPLADIRHQLCLLSVEQPEWKAQIIEADLPWDYDADKGHAGGGTRRGKDGLCRTNPRLIIKPTYTRMAVEEMKSLGPYIRSVVDPKGCLLYMWVTSAFIPELVDVMRAWSDNEKGGIVFNYFNVTYAWVKTRKDGYPFQGAGTGRRVRHDAEYCMVFSTGKIPAPDQELLHSSVILAQKPKRPKGETHSAKPDNIKIIAEKEYGCRWRGRTIVRDHLTDVKRWEMSEDATLEPWLVNRLELFGRTNRPGWRVLGDGK